MRRRLGFIGGAALATLACCAVALALPPYSLAPKTSAAGPGGAEVYDVRTGCHAGFDRVVVDIRFARPGYDVRYVPAIVEDGSGNPVSLPGTAKLRILLRENARGHTLGGVNLLPAVINTGCSNVLQLKLAGDFEGIVTLGVGVAHKKGFRVYRLSGPGSNRRVVVDVLH